MGSDTACKYLSVEKRALAPNLPLSTMNICSLKESDEELKLKLYQIQFEKGLVGATPGILCPPKCCNEKQWTLCPCYEPAS